MESEQPQQPEPPQKVKVKAVPPGPPKSGAASFWEKYGNRLLLGLTVVALLYALVQYRRGATLRAAESASESLTAARQKVAQFRSMDLLRLPPEQVVSEANSLEGTAAPALDSVINDSEQSKLHGQAYVTRGDMYWTLANLPEAPGASTQPSLRIGKSKADYLTAAENAYRRATEQKADPISATVAQFGLGAVAENRGQWDEAKKVYDAIAADANVMSSFKNLATFRAAQVQDLRNPLFITAATQPSVTTAPTTAAAAAAITATTLPASTAPTTRPTP